MHRRSLIAGAAIATLDMGNHHERHRRCPDEDRPGEHAVLDLKQGRVVIQMFPDLAPKQVERIKSWRARDSTTTRRSIA